MQQPSTPPHAASGAPARVLIVDDNVDAADTLADLLRLDGYDAEVCYGEQAALDSARASPPEIVILDIGMPERGGHVLARQLRELLPDVLMIAFTGFSRPDDIERSVRDRYRDPGTPLQRMLPTGRAVVRVDEGAL